jgi:hypothetical protein
LRLVCHRLPALMSLHHASLCACCQNLAMRLAA